MTKPAAEKITIIRKIELRACVISLRNDGILHCHMKEYGEFNIDDAKQMVDAMGELGKGKKMPMITTMGDFASSEFDAKKYLSKKINNKYILASAILTDVVGYKIGTNLFLRFYKPEFPFKLFSMEEDAVKWLKEFTS